MADSTLIGLHHEEEHRPELLHHFADVTQQRNAASLGMWVFLATEVMFFGGMFCAYLVYRTAYFGDFAAASKSIDATLGATNTGVLICSSLTVVTGCLGRADRPPRFIGLHARSYHALRTGLPRHQG